MIAKFISTYIASGIVNAIHKADAKRTKKRITKYANKHNISFEEAEKIENKRSDKFLSKVAIFAVISIILSLALVILYNSFNGKAEYWHCKKYVDISEAKEDAKELQENQYKKTGEYKDVTVKYTSVKTKGNDIEYIVDEITLNSNGIYNIERTTYIGTINDNNVIFDEKITGEKKVATNYEFTMEKDESTMEFINSDGKYFYFEK